MPQDDVLKELGIELPSAEALYTSQQQQPNNPFTPEVPPNLEEVGKTLIAGAIMMLEQAINFYGVTTTQGKSILQAINKLLDVVPEEEVEKMKTALLPPPSAPPPVAQLGVPPMGTPPFPPTT
jgi:hypothetical protein